jgi:hypothetical protein
VAERVESQPLGDQGKARLRELGVRPLDSREEDPLANVVAVRPLPSSRAEDQDAPALCAVSSSRSAGEKSTTRTPASVLDCRMRSRPPQARNEENGLARVACAEPVVPVGSRTSHEVTLKYNHRDVPAKNSSLPAIDARTRVGIPITVVLP